MADGSILVAEAVVKLPDPTFMLDRLAQHFTEYARVTVSGPVTIVESRLGRAELVADQGILRMRALGPTEASLSVVKASLAEHLFTLAGDALPPFAWTGHDAARRDLPYFRTMTVRQARQLTPHMRRVILTGELGGLDQGGLHVRILIPPDGRAPCWPQAREDGRVVWPRGQDTLTARVYTIRRIDPARHEISIDIVVHPGCRAPGSTWARTTQPGEVVGVMGPGGGNLQPADFYLFAGDETALPAIARMLETLPATARAVVRIEVDGPAEEQALSCAASLDLQWLHRMGREPGTTTLLEEAIRQVDWPRQSARLHAWAGCEHAQALALRAQLAARGIDKSACSIAAYWRRDTLDGP